MVLLFACVDIVQINIYVMRYNTNKLVQAVTILENLISQVVHNSIQ